MDMQNPVVQTYVIAALLMCIKMMIQAWVTVYQMIKAKGGYLHPEDLRKTPLNPNPHPEQLHPYPAVERSRAMQRNDLENIPVFCLVGLLFIWSQPPLLLTQMLMYGYVLSRLLHCYALGTAQAHDVRATFYSIGSLIIMGMAVYTLYFALMA